MSEKAANKRIVRRLLPLYVAAFLHGLVLWYSIEKLFMGTIGFNDAGIGVMVAFYGFVMLLFETPSGILADRWSRKGVLILASIFLAIASLVCGLSTEPILYIIGAGFWGVFFAFYSGTYDSIVYDAVHEETGSGDDYEKYYGRVKVIDSAALVLGGLAGGLISQFASMSAAFFWTVPLSLLAIIALCMFREPQLHKSEPLGSVTEQIATTFRSVLGKRLLLPLLAIVVLLGVISELIYEFSQLWLTATSVEAGLYGPAFAFVISSTAIGGYLAGKSQGRRAVIMPLAYGVMVASALALAFVHEFIAIVAAQTALGAAVMLLSILFMRDLHDQLPSSVRAGAVSAVSTMSRLIMALLGLLFGVISAAHGVFAASWVLTVLAVLVVFGGIVRHINDRRTIYS